MITLNKIPDPTDLSPAEEQAFDAARRRTRDSHWLLLMRQSPAEGDG